MKLSIQTVFSTVLYITRNNTFNNTSSCVFMAGACLCYVCCLQDAAQLVDLTTAAADQYAACMADLEQLASCSYPSEAAPQQLRALEAQLRERLEVRCLLPLWAAGQGLAPRNVKALCSCIAIAQKLCSPCKPSPSSAGYYAALGPPTCYIVEHAQLLHTYHTASHLSRRHP
jgi:hypothetical protein